MGGLSVALCFSCHICTSACGWHYGNQSPKQIHFSNWTHPTGTCVLTKNGDHSLNTEAAVFSSSAEGTQNNNSSDPDHHQGKLMRLLRRWQRTFTPPFRTTGVQGRCVSPAFPASAKRNERHGKRILRQGDCYDKDRAKTRETYENMHQLSPDHHSVSSMLWLCHFLCHFSIVFLFSFRTVEDLQ